jgi:hypothetical protein
MITASSDDGGTRLVGLADCNLTVPFIGKMGDSERFGQ